MSRFKIPTGVKFFALLWLFILAFPITREVLIAQTVLTSYSEGEVPYSPSESFTARLYEQFPDSIPMALWISEEEYWSGQGPRGRNQAIDRLEKLRRKHPKELEIPAVELVRLSGDALGKIKADPNIMRKGAKLAAEINRIEPSNAFWPLMESGFYFRANQSKEALQALKKVNRCTLFNDFSQKIIQDRVRFAEQHSSIVYEQKIGIWAGTLYLHLSHLRLATKSATEQALLTKKQGNIQSSLDIMAAIMKGANFMKRYGQGFITPLVAESTARNSLVSFFEMKLKPDAPRLDERMEIQLKLAQRWEQYVKENGRPELAGIVDFMREPSVASLMHHSYDDGYVEITGLLPPWGQIAFTATPVLFWTSILSFSLGFIWILHAIIFSGIKDDVTPNRGQITGCVIFSFWATCGLVIAALHSRVLNFNTYLYSTDTSGYLFPLLIPFFIVGIWLIPVLFVTFVRKFRLIKTQKPLSEGRELSRLSPESNRRRKIAWLLFLLLCGVIRWSWDATVTPAIPALSTALALPCLIIGLRLELLHQKSKIYVKRGLRVEKVNVPTSIVPLAMRVWRLGVWATFLICTVLTLVQIRWNVTWVEIFLPFSIGCCALIGALWLERRAPRDSFAFARKVAVQSAGTLAIVWSLFFIVASLSVWPLRAKLNQKLERRLEIGEIEWIKEVYNQNP